MEKQKKYDCKKIATVIMACILVIVFSACNNTPENYTSILKVEVDNVQLEFYLDENDNVLATKSTSKELKEFLEKTDVESIENTMSEVISSFKQKDLLKENIAFNFQFTEQKDKNKNATIYEKMVLLIHQKSIELGIEMKSEIAGEESKHTWTDATCTESGKCSCGAVKGEPLGHKWQEATCKTPKTCSVCKVTDGDVVDHKYINKKCAFCGLKQVIILEPGVRIESNYFYGGYSDRRLDVVRFYESGGVDIVPYQDVLDEWAITSDTVKYNGKTWYAMNGVGGTMVEYTLTNKEIIIEGNCRLVVKSNGDLEVIFSDNGIFNKGEIIKCGW